MIGVLLIALILVLGIAKWKRSPAQIAPIHGATTTPLFEPHDKNMNIILKGVAASDGRPINLAATIRESKSRYNQMKQAVLAYLQGPRTGKIQVPVPEGMALNEFYLTAQGMAVVDLSLVQLKPEKFGFYEESLFIRGLIETLSGNFFEIKQVKVLVDGQDAPTLVGHYALSTSDVGNSTKVPAAGPVN